MAISITKVVEQINKILCSEHNIKIIDGTVGVILVQCEHCNKRWLAKEIEGGGTQISPVTDTYELPKLAITKDIPKTTEIVQSRGEIKIENPLLKKDK